MAEQPLRDGADALRTARPEVGIARPDGKTVCRNGCVADSGVALRNVA